MTVVAVFDVLGNTDLSVTMKGVPHNGDDSEGHGWGGAVVVTLAEGEFTRIQTAGGVVSTSMPSLRHPGQSPYPQQ